LSKGHDLRANGRTGERVRVFGVGGAVVAAWFGLDGVEVVEVEWTVRGRCTS
jgi:hypothetical protein